MRSEQEVNRAIEQYEDTVRRLCMIHLKNYHDTEEGGHTGCTGEKQHGAYQHKNGHCAE